MQKDGLEAMTAAWGVTPQGQNTGTSPSRMVTGSPVVGAGQVPDADGLREADLDGHAVDAGHFRRYGHRGGHQAVRDGPHADHHVAVEDARRGAGDVGVVHGHVDALLDLAHRDAGLQQGGFKRKAAPDQKADQSCRASKYAVTSVGSAVSLPCS